MRPGLDVLEDVLPAVRHCAQGCSDGAAHGDLPALPALGSDERDDPRVRSTSVHLSAEDLAAAHASPQGDDEDVRSSGWPRRAVGAPRPGKDPLPGRGFLELLDAGGGVRPDPAPFDGLIEQRLEAGELAVDRGRRDLRLARGLVALDVLGAEGGQGLSLNAALRWSREISSRSQAALVLLAVELEEVVGELLEWQPRPRPAS